MAENALQPALIVASLWPFFFLGALAPWRSRNWRYVPGFWIASGLKPLAMTENGQLMAIGITINRLLAQRSAGLAPKQNPARE
jgi:hypothetical protein